LGSFEQTVAVLAVHAAHSRRYQSSGIEKRDWNSADFPSSCKELWRESLLQEIRRELTIDSVKEDRRAERGPLSRSGLKSVLGNQELIGVFGSRHFYGHEIRGHDDSVDTIAAEAVDFLNPRKARPVR
jgi:hypothetical protein